MGFPSTPTSLYINGFPEKAEKLTKNTDGTVAVSAIINDPDSRDKVRMVVRYSNDKAFKSYYTVSSAFGRQGVRHSATMTRLSLNTLYYVRVYTQQRDRLILSKSYNASSFWTATSAPPSALAATSRERLYLNRFGTGFTQRALRQLQEAGTPEAWLEKQLSPASVPEAAKIVDVDTWFAPQWRTPAEKAATNSGSGKKAWEYGNDLGNWSILHRIYSERSVHETMTELWSNLLHIPVGHDRAWVYRFDYDATIRQHALGTFEELLIACSLHPAMRVYLDNAKSVKNKPNENQGRELLELHTVGRSAGYTEAMVKASAVLLSGYTVDWGNTYAPWYNTAAHTTGAVQVLDFSHPNADANGEAATLAYLSYLANHPATARRIATKIATQFVSDSPSDGLVNTLAGVYTSSGTDIRAVLTALSTHPEFLTSSGLKVRTPVADLVATTRVLAVDVLAPVSGSSWANAANYVHGGDRLFSWPRPDGPPLTGAAWSAASRLFNSYGMHENMGGGWWPKEAATYRSRASWLPAPSLRFDEYVDHLCRTWLGREADARLLKAATQAVYTEPDNWAIITASTTINSKHSLASWLFPRLVSALLDTPDHMTT
jgi:uncharacterized protein (DUF1800 family)